MEITLTNGNRVYDEIGTKYIWNFFIFLGSKTVFVPSRFQNAVCQIVQHNRFSCVGFKHDFYFQESA